MIIIECPSCGNKIIVDSYDVSEEVICKRCRLTVYVDIKIDWDGKL